MALIRITTDDDIRKTIEEYKALVYDRVLKMLQYAGEEFVSSARLQDQDHASGHYQDVTGNLRNSIGYIIYCNGEKIFGDAGEFEDEAGSIISSYLNPHYWFQLFAYASMNYASYVEAKGFNVVTIQAGAMFVSLMDYADDVQHYLDGLQDNGVHN